MIEFILILIAIILSPILIICAFISILLVEAIVTIAISTIVDKIRNFIIN